jgi:hypothetical protein
MTEQTDHIVRTEQTEQTEQIEQTAREGSTEEEA